MSEDPIIEMGREAMERVEAEKKRCGVNGPEVHVTVVEPEGLNGRPSRVLLRCAGVDYDVLAWKRSDEGIPVMVRANPKYRDGSGCAYEGYLDPDADFVQVITLRGHRNIGHLALRLHVSLMTNVYVPPPAPPTRAELVDAERLARELLDELPR